MSRFCDFPESGASVSFAQFMEAALYDPECGYYRVAGVGGPGRAGDFFTSVSVGACYGLLLGEWIADYWRRGGCVGEFVIAEQGGHGGELLADVGRAIRERHCDFCKVVKWVSVEPCEELLERQRIRWAEVNPDLVWAGFAGFPGGEVPADGILVVNELLDAFPVHAMEMRGGSWCERRVVREGGKWGWRVEACDPVLEKFCHDWPAGLPEGWRAEARVLQDTWLRDMRVRQPDWAMLVADYGFGEESRWSPERRGGSLRRYRNHKMDDLVLVEPGLCDVTADVDFGQLAAVWEEMGGVAGDLTPQGIFLTRAARGWLLEREADARGFRDPMLRQFQTLTHPALMGRAFSLLPLFPTAVDVDAGAR